MSERSKQKNETNDLNFSYDSVIVYCFIHCNLFVSLLFEFFNLSNFCTGSGPSRLVRYQEEKNK